MEPLTCPQCGSEEFVYTRVSVPRKSQGWLNKYVFGLTEVYYRRRCWDCRALMLDEDAMLHIQQPLEGC